MRWVEGYTTYLCDKSDSCHECPSVMNMSDVVPGQWIEFDCEKRVGTKIHFVNLVQQRVIGCEAEVYGELIV